MTLKWQSGQIKYNAAKQLILKLMDSVYSVNKDVEFSLRVFGHQYTVPQNNCKDTKNEVPFRKDNRQQMELRLEDIHPLGVTSIAYSLQQAAEKDLVDIAHNAYSIILITDGGESCGGNICAVMEMLRKYKVYFKPYIISLENVPGLKKEYECMGDYLQVTASADIPVAVGTIVEAFRPAIRITKKEYQQLQTIAASAPSVLKVNAPVVKIDSVPAVKPPAPAIWQKPAVEKIDALFVARVQLLSAGSVKPIPRPVTFIPGMPEIKKEYEKPAAEAIIRIAPSKLMAFRVTQVPNQPLDRVVVPKPPAIAVPEPEYVKPTSEAIGRMAIAKLKRITLTPPAAATLTSVQVPNVPAIAVPEPEYVRPAPETITHLAAAKLKRVSVTQPDATNLRRVRVPEVPEIAVPEPEYVKPATEAITQLAAAKLKRVSVTQPEATNLRRVRVPDVPAIAVPEPEYVKPATESITRLALSRLKSMRTMDPVFSTIRKTDRVIPVPAIAVEPPPITLPPPEKLSKLQPGKLKQMSVIWVVESHALVPRRVPPLPPIKMEPVAKAPTTKTTALPTAPTTDKLMERTVETEDAKETTLEVYFTNGKGKFFTTTPQILLLDPTTGKLVKKFYRFVGPTGNPDPQKDIPPGTYNLTFADKPSLVVKGVKIEKDKKNKVTVLIRPASLSFAYSEPTNANVRSKRPVSEFTAVVVERNKAQGRVENQKCWEALEYEPGNYHVRITTFPEEVRNVDLDFDEAVIMIQQPGFAKFTQADGKLATVRLYKRVGDKFLQFFELNLRDPQSQHLRIQPGEYQAHYQRGPSGLTSLDKVKMFVIKPTQETEITLD
jgi:hypothetical protein